MLFQVYTDTWNWTPSLHSNNIYILVHVVHFIVHFSGGGGGQYTDISQYAAVKVRIVRQKMYHNTYCLHILYYILS